MTSLVSAILMMLFFLLAAVHFNWVFGGTWGMNKALPTNHEGKRVLNPKWIDSLIVALALLAFGLFYGTIGGIIDLHLSDWINTYAIWIVPGIFLLRAIGDFRYVGFFKRVTRTKFANADTRLFSPLCLAIAVLGCVIALL